jgi:hypothetical protein
VLLYLAQEKLSALVLRIIEELLTLIILNDPVRVDKEFPIGHGLVEGSLHFRVGSRTEVSDGHENVGCWGQSGSRFRAAEGPLIAISGLKPLRNSNRILKHRDVGGGSRPLHQKRTFGRVSEKKNCQWHRNRLA